MPRLRRSSLGRWVDPGDAYVALCGDDSDVVWLDSGPGATVGRSYIGRASRVVTSDSRPVPSEDPVHGRALVPESVEGGMLDFLRADLAANRLEDAGDGFVLGWVGWLGYEMRFETQGSERTRQSAYPDAAFLFIDRALEFDHATRTVWALTLGDAEPLDLDLALRQAQGPRQNQGPRPNQEPSPAQPPVAVWRDTDAQYLAKIRECQARIAAGDAYLLCLTTAIHVDVRPDPLATYLALREASPTHHGALLRIGRVSLLSSSPEQFLSVTPDGAIESRPIKGTRPRGATREQDARWAAELETSEKERAENLMIVDLMRNDIGRVSRVGSVEVPSLLRVEAYATVHQLVSTVRGRLDRGLEAIDAVTACFPAGSMTGAPKSSATRILDELEGHGRGIYSGAFGYFGLDGRVDLAMVIRSIVLSPAGATIGTGGGITSLSDPDEELAEIKLKAAALLGVLLQRE